MVTPALTTEPAQSSGKRRQRHFIWRGVKCRWRLIDVLLRKGIHARVLLCLIRSMIQPDLFEGDVVSRLTPAEAAATCSVPADLPAILERLAATCERPRYSFMVLNLIAQASAGTGCAGPYISQGDERVSVRDWLSQALSPVARRKHHRAAMIARASSELAAAGQLPKDPEQRELAIAAEVQRRVQHSRRTNVSRAVSELVRAGLVQRHYQGYRVDHVNRGAQRQAVYTIRKDVRIALARGIPG